MRDDLVGEGLRLGRPGTDASATASGCAARWIEQASPNISEHVTILPYDYCIHTLPSFSSWHVYMVGLPQAASGHTSRCRRRPPLRQHDLIMVSLSLSDQTSMLFYTLLDHCQTIAW